MLRIAVFGGDTRDISLSGRTREFQVAAYREGDFAIAIEEYKPDIVVSDNPTILDASNRLNSITMVLGMGCSKEPVY